MCSIIKILENNGRVRPIDTYVSFLWYFKYWLRERSLAEERQIHR